MPNSTDVAEMRLQIYPRRKAGQKQREFSAGTAVILTLEVLQSYSNMPLVDASKKLGISKTALKSACRTLGLERWPFRRFTDAITAPDRPETETSDTVGSKRQLPRGSQRAATSGMKRRKDVSNKSLPQNPKHNKEDDSDDAEDYDGEDGKDEVEDEESGAVDVGLLERESCLDLGIDGEGMLRISKMQAADLHEHWSGLKDDMAKIDSTRRRDENWGSGTEEGTEQGDSAQGSSERSSNRTMVRLFLFTETQTHTHACSV